MLTPNSREGERERKSYIALLCSWNIYIHRHIEMQKSSKNEDFAKLCKLTSTKLRTSERPYLAQLVSNCYHLRVHWSTLMSNLKYIGVADFWKYIHGNSCCYSRMHGRYVFTGQYIGVPGSTWDESTCGCQFILHIYFIHLYIFYILYLLSNIFPFSLSDYYTLCPLMASLLRNPEEDGFNGFNNTSL